MLPNYDAATAAKMMRAFVPISMLNKGGAGRIIEEVKRDGVRVIVKNNVPECVMISVEEYDNFVKEASIPKIIPQTKEAEEKRKAFIQRIRQNVPPPIPATRKLADVIKEVGPIYKDDKSAEEAQRILRDLRELDLRRSNDTLRY
ncbi:MAG: type II toxin-antitoxin system prevent-host-death family antitoxin [Treponema sp.]|nr:type II toxin-antitoxin system prevent-host-death family antitoxin [Treponema sp.]MEE3436293.1 type II toxin-antitoxin system prevent-host-death family antitoxin [Treponema sp.]